MSEYPVPITYTKRLSSSTASVFFSIKMDCKQSQHVCVRIKFQNVFEYCEIGLTNLTRDSFLNDGRHIRFFSIATKLMQAHQSFLVVSLVPKVVSSSPNVDLSIYDHLGALIPINLLKKVITMRSREPEFHLKISLSKLDYNQPLAKVY